MRDPYEGHSLGQDILFREVHVKPHYIKLPPGVTIRRFALKSYLYGFFGPHEMDELFTDYQLFTISRDGTVTLSCKSESGKRPKAVESIRFLIEREQASKIIDDSVAILKKCDVDKFICDGPSWSLTLTDTEGSEYRAGGSMWADPEYNGIRLSEYIREMLSCQLIERGYSPIDVSRFALFDGCKDSEQEDDRLFLTETIVAGLEYAVGLGYVGRIVEEEPVRLVREPENSYDDMAIAVYYNDDRIGYLPRKINTTFANLMDGGKQLYAEISRKIGSKVLVSIYLDEAN